VKVGVLEFRTGISKRFVARARSKGRETINIGDWIQSVAVRALLESLGVAREDVVAVDRNAIPTYRGPPVRLVMNACFYEDCLPLPSGIEPVFIGFQTSSPNLVRDHIDLFRRHEPIGCRDEATRRLLRAQGVGAYVTGCLTTSLPLRRDRPTTPRTFFIGGDGAGAMPKTLARHVPRSVRRGSVQRNQREPVASVPLSDDDVRTAWSTAERLLATYEREATLAVTPLLHAAGPCLAMGIPVVLARAQRDDRFTAIDRVLPLHTPDTFHAIDWNPACPDLEGLKACLRSLVADALERKAPSEANLRFLEDFYGRDAVPIPARLGTNGVRSSRLSRFPLLWRLFRA
jgi:hypothetical protein